MGQYDILLRHVARRYSHDMAVGLLPTAPIRAVRWIDTQLTAIIERRADKALELETGDGPGLLKVEFAVDPGRSIFFRMFDPQHRQEAAVFEQLGYVDIQHLAPRIRSKVLWPIGLMDQICPPSSQFAAYNKITSVKEMAIYPDFGHEGLPGVNDIIFQYMMGL